MGDSLCRYLMGGRNTIVMHNTCEDSLLAAPLILDMCLIVELSTRIEFKSEGEEYHGEGLFVYTGSHHFFVHAKKCSAHTILQCVRRCFEN